MPPLTLATAIRIPLIFVCWIGCMSGTASCQASSETTPTVPPKAHTIRTIYVVPSSHWDLGFTAPPEEVLPKLKPHLDAVIAAAKADPDFRWTIESVWQIREWLARTQDPAEIQAFVDLVK